MIVETKTPILNRLSTIPAGRMYQAGQKALMRLHLFSTGRIHEALLELNDKAKSAVLRNADSDGTLNSAGALKAQRAILDAWADTFEGLRRDLLREREEAGRIAIGVAAMMHERVVRKDEGGRQTAEGREWSIGEEGVLEERAVDGVFDPQLRILLSTAEEYLYGNGLNLSGRLWKLDRESRDGINQVLMNGISTGESAWNIAKQLEQFLGPNADCPRWTSTRLYQRTKKEIAGGDVTGLIRGDACNGQGVAYNALRLARTEIQKIHALATDRMMAQQPWVQQEQVHLSAAHPGHDECDDAVSGGENGNGIYAVGTIELPLHPNCLCFKTAVMMDEAEFTAKLRGWMQGTESWSEMDAYERSVGGDVSISLLPDAMRLAVWMFGDQLES